MCTNRRQMYHLKHLTFFLLLWIESLFFSVQEPLNCDILDETCHQQSQKTAMVTQNGSAVCNNLQNFWLIPGHSDTSCTRPGAKRLIDVNPRLITIRPPVLQFPGCFEIEIKNIRISNPEGPLATGIFAKSEYQWLNMKEFDKFQCQNASNDGCGGFGNNCYYCDICESINKMSHDQPTAFTEQLQNLKCPSRPGYYTFRKKFCFNDWLNANGDCRDVNNATNLKAAFASLQQLGYGTIVAKIRLAHNASEEVIRNKILKESQIENAVNRELLDRRQMKFNRIDDDQFRDFYQWYVEYKKNVWHREEYLPWLLYENEISCLRFTFNVCERPPTRHFQSGRDVFACN